jgi:hypothetical protein
VASVPLGIDLACRVAVVPSPPSAPTPDGPPAPPPPPPAPPCAPPNLAAKSSADITSLIICTMCGSTTSNLVIEIEPTAAPPAPPVFDP